jgi:hypothetical protein
MAKGELPLFAQAFMAVGDLPKTTKPEQCTHLFEEPTVTVWPGETCERLTMTCAACDRVRGRYPGEGTNR